MPNVLDEIVANTQKEVAERKSILPESELKGKVKSAHGEFLAQLRKPGIKLIAEIKPMSPSKGVLKSEIDLPSILRAYNAHASAISVLTDRRYFGGSFDLLSQVQSGSPLPTLCKDFIIDPYQCYEARQAGAKAALLIVKILESDLLAALYRCICDLGMTPVVEVQSEKEMEIASGLNPQIILINNRNLTTFEIDLSTTSRLAAVAPDDAVIISASGIETASDIRELMPAASAFLIGTSIMQSADIGEKLKELLNVEACTN